MGPDRVGVDVDHLGLDPQAELHAQPAHVVDQGVQTVRPHVGVDGPVAEAGGVAPAPAEPAVVEDEAVHPDRGRDVGERREPVEVVVEVDGLPGVGHHRCFVRRVGRLGAEVGVEAVAHRVEPGAGPRAQQPGAPVGLARREAHLAGRQQLPAAQEAVALRGAFGVRRVVAAPRGVHAPHLPGREPEAGCSGDQEQRGVVARAAAPSVPPVGALHPRVPLRRAFLAPATREVEQLGRDGADRQSVAGRRQVQGAVERVGHRRAHADEPGGAEREVDVDGPAGLVVTTGERRGRVAVGRILDPSGPAGRAGRRRGGRPADAVPLEDRGAGEAAGVVGHETGAPRRVERGPRDARSPGGDQLVEARVVEVAEVGTPVHHHRDAVVVRRDEQAHPRASQVDRRADRLVRHRVSPPGSVRRRRPRRRP